MEKETKSMDVYEFAKANGLTVMLLSKEEARFIKNRRREVSYGKKD